MQIIKIASRRNQYIKYIKSLHKPKTRRLKEQFIIEGIRLFTEAFKSDLDFKMIFVTERFSKSVFRELKKETFKKTEKIFVISDGLMNYISQLETPPGILGVAKHRILKKGGFKASKDEFFLILENLQDPGNLGTILRTALAAGIKKIILSADSVDIYNSKVIRASAGAVFNQEIYYFKDLLAQLKKNKKQGIRLIATSPETGESIFNFSFTQPAGIILGSEAHGISPKLLDLADKCVFIPLFQAVESFNVAVTCGIILYEIIKQNKEKLDI